MLINILVIYVTVAQCLNHDFNYLKNHDEVQYLSGKNSMNNNSLLRQLIRKRSSAQREINSLITVNDISAKKMYSPNGRFYRKAKFLNPLIHFNKKRKRAVSTLDKISVGDTNSNSNNAATEKSAVNGTTPLEIGDETEYCGQHTTPITTTTELDPCFSPTTTESAVQTNKSSPKCVQKKECTCETTECPTTPQECEETTTCPTPTTSTCPTTTITQECEEITTCPPPTTTTCPTVTTTPQECEEITTCPTITTTTTTCATTPQECQETTTLATTCPPCSMQGRKECPSCVNSLKELSVLLNKLINKIGPHQRSVRAFEKRNNEKKLQQKRKRSRNKRKWGEWTDWSSCSVSCGKGRQIKWRQCEDHCHKVETELLEKTCQKPACSGKLFGFIKL